MNYRNHAFVETQEPSPADRPSHSQPTVVQRFDDGRALSAGNDPVCADASYAADLVSPFWLLTYGLYLEARTRRTRLLYAIAHRLWRASRQALGYARERIRQRREARMTSAALRDLDDRTLLDLGFHRLEISSIAAQLSGGGDPTRRATLGTFAECP